MEVRSPIFLNCFSRGGSNIFWNLLLSHPDVCSPIRETLQIFSVHPKRPTWAGVQAALRSGQPRLFDQWKLGERRPLSASAMRYVDRTLKSCQRRTLVDEEMRYKADGELYSAAEVENARLCTKNNNGLVFLTPLWQAMYPSACFFALVREPVALYESHKRRGLTRSPALFARFYNRVAGRMLDDAERYDRAAVFRFEDVLAEPVATARRLYEIAGLDPGKVTRLRFKSKAHFRGDGSRGTAWEEGRHRWLSFEEAGDFLDSGVNELQASRLDAEERRTVLAETAELRQRLGDAPTGGSR